MGFGLMNVHGLHSVLLQEKLSLA
ncbi:hypothetical protein CBM2592_P400017 [Cupriavidus taiwanensis]|uniref:Uncharacterized protein n=2 Tax=Cupriavidus TaxID=106589 RepID=A0A375F8B3_9BURK|nr:hypothetical protein CBM2585_P380017 [Cupriavidus taiwanensis]SOZ40698.1 hypothetical protein CBM2605_P380019 [Cupriavidus neocaledonicus]SOY76618.1 hypothetical protein CBM2588_P420019 [Cupriavidus taiwanensis]SOY76672.1 hypothetical protein CBM2592_P400017 [Cupriavidus taiwanensis]SOY76975.1 hypothetical protein CBM2589_P380018 [Cupriavidus taiwanensis]